MEEGLVPLTRTPLKSDYNTDSLKEIQIHDGLYGVMLAALRNLEENTSMRPDRSAMVALAHTCLLNASKEFVSRG